VVVVVVSSAAAAAVVSLCYKTSSTVFLEGDDIPEINYSIT